MRLFPSSFQRFPFLCRVQRGFIGHSVSSEMRMKSERKSGDELHCCYRFDLASIGQSDAWDHSLFEFTSEWSGRGAGTSLAVSAVHLPEDFGIHN